MPTPLGISMRRHSFSLLICPFVLHILLFFSFCYLSWPVSPMWSLCIVCTAGEVCHLLPINTVGIFCRWWRMKCKNKAFQFRWFISNTFPRYCNLLPCILAVLILVHMKSHLIPTFVFYRNAIITKQDFIFKFRVHSGFFCTEHVSLLPHYRVDRHGNSCCNHNLLWSRLCSRLEVNRYEITDYWPVISLETSISNPIRQYCSIIYSI